MKIKYIFSGEHYSIHLCFLKFINTETICEYSNRILDEEILQNFDYCIINKNYNYLHDNFIEILIKQANEKTIVIDEEKYQLIKCDKSCYIYNKILNNYDIYNSVTFNKLSELDYNNGYLEFMKNNFTNYDYVVDFEKFASYFSNNHVKILVIYDGNEKIIGSGSLFILNKIHNNALGLLEDIVIHKDYRGIGLGFILIEKLKLLSKNYNCYKTILNCNENNVDFYKKNDFVVTGVEMKCINY